jgi:hypothetical protein
MFFWPMVNLRLLIFPVHGDVSSQTACIDQALKALPCDTRTGKNGSIKKISLRMSFAEHCSLHTPSEAYSVSDQVIHLSLLL